MRQLLLFTTWLCYATPLSAQIFEKTFPVVSDFLGIAPTSDGNFVTIGTNGTAQPEAFKAWLTKISSSGEVLWEKNYLPAGTSAIGYSVTPISDGGFVITGRYGNYPFYSGSYVMKVAPQGSPVWAKTFSDEIYTVAQTINGELLVGGTEESSEDAIVYRLSATGNIISQFNYSAYLYNGHVMKIFPQADGSFFAAGRGEVTGAGFQGIFLLRAKANGDTIWTKHWNTGNYYQDIGSFQIGPMGAVQAANGDIIIADGSNNGAILIRYSPDGDQLWIKNYGNLEDGIAIFDLEKDNNGNLFLAGNKRKSATNTRINFLLKTSPNGTEQWSQAFDDPGNNVLTGVVVRADGTPLIAGQRQTEDVAYLAGLDENGYRFKQSVSISLKRDTDGDCTASTADIAMPHTLVRISNNDYSFTLSTDANGIAKQPVPPGTYSIEIQKPSSLWKTCTANPEITVPDLAGAVAQTEILVTPAILCAMPAVALTSPDLVRCHAGVYHIQCRNLGTASAADLKIRISKDPVMVFESASWPVTETGDYYEFDAGSLAPLEEKRFSLTLRLLCNAEIGQAHCIEATISPVPECALPPQSGWSGASIEVKAKCVGSTVHLTATNTGSGNMTASVPYQILADGWRMESGEILLNAGQTWSRDYPAEGRAIWMEAGQAEGHPGRSRPVAGWEGCGVTDNGFAGTGFLNMFEYDNRNFYRSATCEENRRMVLPDHMEGIPKGYGWYHFIDFDCKPDYELKFQNKLPSATTNVRARVILSPVFKTETFRITASSHPCHIKSAGDHAVDIILDNAELAAAAQDSFASWGYIRFRADLNLGALDTGTRIINSAQVYFGDDASSNLRDAYHFTAPKDFAITDDPSPYSDQPGMKVYAGSSGFDFMGDVVQNPDGTKFLLSTAYSYGIDYDLVVMKLDGFGRGIWQKVYDFDGGDVFSYAIADGEGGFIATGYQDDPAIPDNYSNDVYLPIVRINADGEVVWYRREKPGTGTSGRGGQASGMVRSSDGDYVITGTLTNGTASSLDNFLLKINPEGQTVWFKNYLLAGVAFYPAGVRETADGGYLMCGNDDADWPNTTRFQKTDALGNTLWEKEHPYISDVTPNGMSDFTLTPDGGIVWLGYVSDYNIDSQYVYWPVLTRLDQNGTLLWRKKMEIGLIVYPGNIICLPNGNIVFTGEVFEDNNSSYLSLLLAATDPDGNLLWWKSYAANTSTAGEKIYPAENDQLLITAQTQTSNYLYNLASVLLFVGADGTLGTHTPPPAKGSQLMTWPNPARDYLQVSLKTATGPLHWELYDIKGVLAAEGDASSTPFTITTTGLSMGAYQLSVKWKDNWQTRPVIISGN